MTFQKAWHEISSDFQQNSILSDIHLQVRKCCSSQRDKRYYRCVINGTHIVTFVNSIKTHQYCFLGTKTVFINFESLKTF